MLQDATKSSTNPPNHTPNFSIRSFYPTTTPTIIHTSTPTVGAPPHPKRRLAMDFGWSLHPSSNSTLFSYFHPHKLPQDRPQALLTTTPQPSPKMASSDGFWLVVASRRNSGDNLIAPSLTKSALISPTIYPNKQRPDIWPHR